MRPYGAWEGPRTSTRAPSVSAPCQRTTVELRPGGANYYLSFRVTMRICRAVTGEVRYLSRLLTGGLLVRVQPGELRKPTLTAVKSRRGAD
jgi:hypothetical protein